MRAEGYTSIVTTRLAPLAQPIAGLDPEVVARGSVLLRALDRATQSFTDVLDVAGFPLDERRSDLALLSTLASGLPSITLEDVIESLRGLALSSGPSALYPEAGVFLSLPDEARELLYIVEPLAAFALRGGHLPRHAGARLQAAPLAFSLTQAKTGDALAEIVSVLRQLMRLPLRPRELTAVRRSPLTPPSDRPATAICLGLLIVGVLAVVLLVLLVSGQPLPFDINRLLP